MKYLLILVLLFSFVQAQNNWSLSFDGGDDATEVIAGYRSSDTQGTFSVWVKPTNFIAVGTIINSSDAASTGTYFIIDIQTDGKVQLTVRNSSTSPYNRVKLNTTALTAAAWNHIIIKSNNSAYTGIVNGVGQSISVVGGANNGDWFDVIGNRDNILLGLLRRSDDDYNYYLGLMDEFAYFSAATTTAQDAQLYNNGTPKDISGLSNLIDYWKIEEGTGTITVDEDADNAFTFGAAGAAPSWSSDTPGWDSGDQSNKYNMYNTYPKNRSW